MCRGEESWRRGRCSDGGIMRVDEVVGGGFSGVREVVTDAGEFGGEES